MLTKILHLAQLSEPNLNLQTSLPSKINDTTGGQPIQTALQIFFGIIGAVALLMIVIGGFRFVISRGDPQAVAKARNTILYAAVGLIIAIAAFSIVTFVITNIG